MIRALAWSTEAQIPIVLDLEGIEATTMCLCATRPCSGGFRGGMKRTLRPRPAETLVGPVGLEPTTYGLKERPKPVGRVGDPLFRAWFVDAG